IRHRHGVPFSGDSPSIPADLRRTVMRKHALLIGVASLLVAAEVKDDQATKELQKFAGTWVMVTGEKDGQKIADEHVKKSKITWKGKECAVDTPHQSKETIRGTVKVDPSKQPKEMDWVRSAGPHAGKTMHAIY